MILETGMVELQPSEFDLSALLEETRGRMQPLGDRHPIRVDAPEHLPLIADRERIEQVVVNPLSNAIRKPEGGPIDVTVERANEKIHLAVRDHRLGTPKAHRQPVFERAGSRPGSALPA